MFGISKLFEKGKSFFHQPDGNVDVDIPAPNNSAELRETGGICAECVWMTGMDQQSIRKCNDCVGHRNFTPRQQQRDNNAPKRRKRDGDTR